MPLGKVADVTAERALKQRPEMVAVEVAQPVEGRARSRRKAWSRSSTHGHDRWSRRVTLRPLRANLPAMCSNRYRRRLGSDTTNVSDQPSPVTTAAPLTAPTEESAKSPDWREWRHPGAQELEALITLTGDTRDADALVWSRLSDVTFLALGRVDEHGLAHLLHCTVPVGRANIAMLPVFTSFEHLKRAVQLNDHLRWRELQAIEVKASAVLTDLDPGEFLGINPWTDHEFKLPPPRRRGFLFFGRRRR